MKNLPIFFLVLFVVTLKSASAVTTLTGCTGGDFGDDCSLAELKASGSIQVDDIVFDNWDVNVVQGSLSLISVVAIDDGSLEPGPGLLFTGPGAASNESVGFEMNYDVSTADGTQQLTGYEVKIEFVDRLGTATGFAAMEVTDNVLLDTLGSAVEIANPEPTVTESVPILSDQFTNCNNEGDCPAVTPPLSSVISSDLRVTTNLDASGGASGSFTAFSLAQRFSLWTNPPVVTTGCLGGDFGSDCSLAELDRGGTIQINDILFDNWDVDAWAGSLNQIRVTAVGENSNVPGPGLRFEGPGVSSNEVIGFEAFYDVSAISGTPILNGYQVDVGFDQLTGTAGGFAAMQLSDNVLVDTSGSDLLIANPEPTVDQDTPLLSGLFTSCDNGITVNCPMAPDPALPRILSQDFRVTTNLDIGGGANGSFSSFDLTQRFFLVGKPPLCFPVKNLLGTISILCM